MDQECQDPCQGNHPHPLPYYHPHHYLYHHHQYLHLGKGVRQNFMLPSLATNLSEQSAEAGDLNSCFVKKMLSMLLLLLFC